MRILSFAFVLGASTGISTNAATKFDLRTDILDQINKTNNLWGLNILEDFISEQIQAARLETNKAKLAEHHAKLQAKDSTTVLATADAHQETRSAQDLGELLPGTFAETHDAAGAAEAVSTAEEATSVEFLAL